MAMGKGGKDVDMHDWQCPGDVPVKVHSMLSPPSADCTPQRSFVILRRLLQLDQKKRD